MPERAIDTTWVDGQIGYLVRRAAAAMAADWATTAEDGRLRPVLVSMLSVIAANPGLGQTELGGALGIQRTNTAPLVAELVAAGLVERRTSPIDGRRVELRLTPTGAAALATGRAHIAAHEDRMTRRLDRDERAQLCELLHRIIGTDGPGPCPPAVRR